MNQDNVQSITKKGSKGRPKEDELSLARKSAVRAENKKIKMESAFKDAIFVGQTDVDKESPEIIELTENAEKRFEIARELTSIRMRKYTLSQSLKELDDSSGDQANMLKGAINACKTQNTRLRNEMLEIPRLGISNNEWESMTRADRNLDVGRPKLTLEERCAHAFYEADTAIQTLNMLEVDRGLPVTKRESLSTEGTSKEVTKRIGRPSLNKLGILDKELKFVGRKIKDLYIDQMKRAGDAPSKNTAGRKAVPFKEKMRILRTEYARLTKAIAEEESELEGIALIERELKVLKDRRRPLRMLRSKGGFKGSEDEKLLAEVEKKVSAVESRIRALRIEEKNKLTEEQIRAIEARKLAIKKAQVADQYAKLAAEG